MTKQTDSAEVRRYDIYMHSHDVQFLRECPDGDYVRFSAYDQLLAENARLRGDINIVRLERDAKLCSECPRNDSLRKAEAERAALSAELERITRDRDAKSARMWELGGECDRLSAELEKARKDAERLRVELARINGEGSDAN